MSTKGRWGLGSEHQLSHLESLTLELKDVDVRAVGSANFSLLSLSSVATVPASFQVIHPFWGRHALKSQRKP